MITRRETGNFLATDQLGNGRTVSIYTTYHRTAKSDSAPEEVPTTRDFVLPDGNLLAVVRKGKYRDIMSGMMYTSDDPNAP